MKRKGQSEKTRRARELEGSCPTHGIPVVQAGADAGGIWVKCPREDCDYLKLLRHGSKELRIMNSSLRIVK